MAYATSIILIETIISTVVMNYIVAHKNRISTPIALWRMLYKRQRAMVLQKSNKYQAQ